MKINITRDEKGRISSIDARSENQDGHLSKEEYELVKKVIEEDSNEEKKRVEEFHKASVGKHKEWASVSATIITGFCEAVVDYLEEKEIRDATKPKEIRDATKPKEPEFDTSVDHLDLTGPKDEESKSSKKVWEDPEKAAYYAANKFA